MGWVKEPRRGEFSLKQFSASGFWALLNRMFLMALGVPQRHSTLDLNPQTLNPKPSTLNPKLF